MVPSKLSEISSDGPTNQRRSAKPPVNAESPSVQPLKRPASAPVDALDAADTTKAISFTGDPLNPISPVAPGIPNPFIHTHPGLIPNNKLRLVVADARQLDFNEAFTLFENENFKRFMTKEGKTLGSEHDPFADFERGMGAANPFPGGKAAAKYFTQALKQMVFGVLLDAGHTPAEIQKMSEDQQKAAHREAMKQRFDDGHMLFEVSVTTGGLGAGMGAVFGKWAAAETTIAQTIGLTAGTGMWIGLLLGVSVGVGYWYFMIKTRDSEDAANVKEQVLGGALVIEI